MNSYQKLSLMILISSLLLFFIIASATGKWMFLSWGLSTIAIALTLWKIGSNRELTKK